MKYLLLILCLFFIGCSNSISDTIEYEKSLKIQGYNYINLGSINNDGNRYLFVLIKDGRYFKTKYNSYTNSTTILEEVNLK